MEKVKDQSNLPRAEKPEESLSGSEAIDAPGLTSANYVDPVASKKLARKMDLHLFPLLAGLYVMSFLDRTNIGNARLYGLEADLGMRGSDYQLAVSILFVTYITFEVPGSIFLKKMTPRLFISVSAGIWGVLSMCTGFCNSFGSLIGLRLLLGIAEAAYFPGVVFYLTFFYRRRELAFRLFYMFAASALSGSVGGLLAYGIGFMDGVQGHRAWRWVFILEGIPTIILAILAGIYLPNDTASARFLTEEEKALCLRRFEADQASLGPAEKAGKVDWGEVKAAFKDWKVWSMSLCQMGNTAMLYTYSTFLPTIIRALGYTSYQTQLLTIPCYFCGALCFCITGYFSDKLGWRGPFAVLGHFVSCLGYAIVLACSKTNAGAGAQYAGCIIIAMGLYTAVGLPLSWNVTNLPSTYKRATANGFMFAMANSSGVWSPFVYQTSDAPGYTLGHSVILAVVFVGGFGYAIISYKLHRENKFRDKGGRDYLLTEKSAEEIAKLGDYHPSYRYVP